MDKYPNNNEKLAEASIEGFPSLLMEAINKSIQIKVSKAAAKFYLTESQVEELEAEVRCKVLASFVKHNNSESGFLTYVQFVIANHLTNWKKHEFLKRMHFAPMTEELEMYADNLASNDEERACYVERQCAVQYIISHLKGIEKRVCELHMRLGTLEAVRKAIGQSCSFFYTVTWPLTQQAFMRIYNETFA